MTDPNTAPTELLPCPFCGSTDIATDGPSYTLFMCNGCGGQTYDQGSHAEAIAAWNHRAPTAMQPDGLDREPGRCWPLGGYAPGSYSCQCISCGKLHVADKRATQCLVCAVSDTAAHITRLEADVVRLTKDLNLARQMFDDCVDQHNAQMTRAETAEDQNKVMRDLVEQAFRDGLAYGSNVSNGNEPGIASIAWAGSRARATLSTIKEGGGKPS